MTIETPLAAVRAAGSSLDAIARAAAIRTVEQGGPYLVHLLGLHTVGPRAVGRRTLGIAPTFPLRPEPSILILAAIADIACGASLASHFAARSAATSPAGHHPRLATLTLTLHLVGSSALSSAAVRARARSISVEDSEAAAAVTAYDASGRALAFGQSTFLHLPAPVGAVLRSPWERSKRSSGLDKVSLGKAAPDWAEQAVLSARRAASAVSPGTFWDNFASPDPASWERIGPRRFRGMLPNGPEKRNRVGHAQGGIVFAGMAIAANWTLRGSTEPGWTLLNGHVRFLRPGVDPALPVECEVLRTGASVSDVLVRLGEPGREVAIGQFVLEPRSQRGDSATAIESD